MYAYVPFGHWEPPARVSASVDSRPRCSVGTASHEGTHPPMGVPRGARVTKTEERWVLGGPGNRKFKLNGPESVCIDEFVDRRW